MTYVNMQSTDTVCFACGGWADASRGIPVYEDIVLPNSWTGEWFGAPACDECFAAQNRLTFPVLACDLVELAA